MQKVYEVSMSIGEGGCLEHYVLITDSKKKIYEHFLKVFRESKEEIITPDDIKGCLSHPSNLPKAEPDNLMLTKQDLKFDLKLTGKKITNSKIEESVNFLIAWYCKKIRKTSLDITWKEIRLIFDTYAQSWVDGIYIEEVKHAHFL